MIKRYIIIVTNTVQGVSFQDTARKLANRLGLNARTRNTPDGSMYIEVEGGNVALREFLRWCPEGSEYSEIEEVRQSEYVAMERAKFMVQ